MRMHVLQGNGNLYQVIVHATTPAGNNAAGISWKVALANSGMQLTSRLPTGNGAGQITVNEANQVASGDLIETELPWEDNPAWTTNERLADLNARATIAVNQTLESYQNKLKYFGFTVA